MFGFCLHFGAVGVDGGDGAVEEVGDFLVVGDAKAHQGEYALLGGELAGGGHPISW